MVEESCPTTRGYGGNHICVCISWDEPVSQARGDALTRMKERKKKRKVIGSVCDSRWFFDHLVSYVTQI